MWNLPLDLLFPKHSLHGSEGEWITDEERQRMKLEPIRLHRELLRKRNITSLDCLIAAGSYQSSPLLKKAIRTFKYGRISELGPELAEHILSALPGLLLLPLEKNHTFNRTHSTLHSEPVLVPVPLHWTRLHHRGFNQASILAKTIGEKKGWPVAELLKRTRQTGHQAWRKRAERLASMTNAFAYIGPSPAPRYVLLVDDIATTCATLDACAKTLKETGVQHVVGLVVAYG